MMKVAFVQYLKKKTQKNKKLQIAQIHMAKKPQIA
jgi:hypothetical protein